MPTAATLKEIVSGSRKGVSASLVRGLLRAAESPYAAAMQIRNWRYDTGRAAALRVAVPVVSIGNLTLGGTGKTPMVEYVVRWLAEHGLRPAIVSRGYGARADSPNDEALELAARLPGVPHVQNRDRVAAAREAIERHRVQAIVADDAFQHRRLARDLDIVLLDATCPFGYGHVFPRGLLREPAAGLSRAAVVILTRADLVVADERERIRGQAASLAPSAIWVEAAHAPLGLVNASGGGESLATLRGKKVAAFCGIGNPAAFRRTLEGCGCNVTAFREYPDHHAYSRSASNDHSESDEADLAAWVQAEGAEWAITTHKDLVKLPIARLGSRPLFALTVGLSVLAGTESLNQALTKAVR